MLQPLAPPAMALPAQQFRPFYLKELLPLDHVLIVNTQPYMLGSKQVYVLTRLSSKMYRIEGQTVLAEDEYQAILVLLEAYPAPVAYPDDSLPIHRLMARCKPKLAELGIELFRTRQHSYGLRPIMNNHSGKP
jgi:hypothetical protein